MRRIVLASTFVLAVAGAAILGFGVGWNRPRWTPSRVVGPLDGLKDSLFGPADARGAEVEEEMPPGPLAVVEREPEDRSPGEGGDPAPPLPTVRLASDEVVRLVGIETAEAGELRHVHRLAANAETAYDVRRYATVSPRVGGFLQEVRVDLGQSVRQGEVLAVVDSAEISAAKTQYLTAEAAAKLAHATYDRTRALARTGQMAARTELESLTVMEQADAALMDAEQRLRNLGLDEGQIAHVLESEDKASLLDVASPIDGAVVLLKAVRGEAVQPTAQLFAVADTSRMWLWIDVYEADIHEVAEGQAVAFVIAGTEEPAASGAVTWIGTEVNPTTRTTRVRAELDNPRGRLRANQFGKALLRLGEEHRAVVVPEAAVQRWDRGEIVFVPRGEHAYQARRVRTRPLEEGGGLEVVEGLEPGERVVTAGAYRLKSEVEKDTIAEE